MEDSPRGWRKIFSGQHNENFGKFTRQAGCPTCQRRPETNWKR